MKEQSSQYTKFSAALAEIAKNEGPPWLASVSSTVAAIQQIASEATEAEVQLAVGRLEKLDKKACAWAESLGANPRPHLGGHQASCRSIDECCLRKAAR